MKILLASSEVFPFSKSGGLADMVGALAKFLAKAGHQVGVVTPLFRGMQEHFPKIETFDWQLDLPLGTGRTQAGVRTMTSEEGVTFYFIDHPGFYQRTGLYQENGLDYADNAARFIFFSK